MALILQAKMRQVNSRLSVIMNGLRFVMCNFEIVKHKQMAVMESFHNISNDQIIYRVFDKKWLVKVFESKKLILRKPRLWDDPFENFMERVIIHERKIDKLIELGSTFNKVFGQCWTLEEENDVMWRIYPSRGKGVKVKTTAGRLFKAIKKAVESDPIQFVRSDQFIGAVDYKSIDKIIDEIKKSNPLLHLITGNMLVPLLFMKREEFQHEKEVRLIFMPAVNKYKSDKIDHVEFNIEPCDLFDEIILDPRIVKESKIDRYIAEFRSFGFTKSIKQSELYKVPETIDL